MKKIVLLTGFLLPWVLGFSQLSWYAQNSGTNAFLFAVCFSGPQSGWVSGTGGLILHTSDGGENWAEQEAPPNNAYYGIYFTDDQHGWASGFGGAIIHTSDGGETWYAQSSGSSTFLYDVFFADEYTGWIVGGDQGSYPSFIPHRVILHTTDGGDTWTHQINNSDESPLKSVHFVDMNTGYAVGEAGSVLYTSNGGLTWTVKMSDLSYHFQSVFFSDAATGWVVGQYLGLPHVSVIFSTGDGGSNWESQTFGTDESLACVYFVNDVIGWAGGGTATSCTMLKTEDGGITWSPEDPGTTNLVYGMHFESEVLGWAVGHNGTIISTELDTRIPGHHPDALFEVYPNPTAGKLFLHVGPDFGYRITLLIKDIAGNTVFRSQDEVTSRGLDLVLDLNELSAGIYVITANNGNEILTKKIVVNP